MGALRSETESRRTHPGWAHLPAVPRGVQLPETEQMVGQAGGGAGGRRRVVKGDRVGWEDEVLEADGGDAAHSVNGLHASALGTYRWTTRTLPVRHSFPR